jgi:hypothetical protein
MSDPTPVELASALRLTDRAKRDLQNQPCGFAAECDIARRLGDRAMYQRCLENLETIAPGHYETLRARQLGSLAQTPPWVPVLWLLLVASVCATFAHALGRALGRRGKSAAVVAVACLAFLPSRASAQEAPQPMLDQAPLEHSIAAPGGLSKWKINDADPLKSVPTPEQRDSDPLNFGYHLMDLADKAQAAVDKGDFTQASKYWEATVLAVPEVAVGYRKTCNTAEQAQDMNRALRYCRAALARTGVELADYQHYAALLMSKPEPLNQEQLTDLQEISKHVRTLQGGSQLADSLDCEYSVRTADLKRLEECVTKLKAVAPDDPKTITYAWTLALGREKFDEARSLIDRARKTPMKPEGIQSMERATAEQASLLRRLQRHPKLVAGGLSGLAALAVIWGISRLLSRRRTKPAGVAPIQTA